jgi:glycosyltransferase involved in cell wall biosynthesis
MARNKVWLVLPWAPSHQGGVTGVVKQIAGHWGSREDLEPAVVVDDWDAVRPSRRPDAIYFRFQTLDVSSPFRLLLSSLALIVRLKRIWRVLRDEQVTAVNFHYTGLSPLGVAVLKSLGLYQGTLVISFHGTDVHPPINAFDKWLRKFCYQQAEAMVACSASLADRMATAFDFDRSRINVIFNGADAEIFKKSAPATPRLAGRLPRTYLVSIGAFIPRKAQTDLLDAFALTVHDYPALYLCLAGPTGQTLEALRQQAIRLGLASRVHFHVGLDPTDVAYLLAGATLCVQPALAESMPLSVLEAGAVGVPVAVSNIPGHDELVVDGQTGRLFKVRDPFDCSNVIKEMLGQPELSCQYAERLQFFVQSRLTWEQCVAKYALLYLKEWGVPI